METISISKLKAHLSAELKKVPNGTRIVVLDHNHPVAELVPAESEALFVREAERNYTFEVLDPITSKSPDELLREERSDRW